ncbi:hypothetical protein NM688_g9124 [Phlebia brevispora]|uniref:Uncharacterized protein n=1 Tax=Phlebia brevispora TaxID=194682 RepID=A0ACC1RMP3_9APHY|nr:hypothetical protein NM688_g9124 [Phlebia brevispora]
MQTLWSPPPVFILFRRIVNVVSSLSISHHYLLGKSPVSPEASDRNAAASSYTLSRPFQWLGWFNRDQDTPALAMQMQGEVEAAALPPKEPPPAAPRRRTTANTPLDLIHRLMNSPLLFDPIRVPRNPLALCHGLYGFDVRGPEAFPMLRQHYWSNVLAVLRQKIGAEVIVTSVPATGSIASRARSLHNLLCNRAQGQSINFIAHSMGGLDCRHLITHIKPTEYTPASLTTIATPHRGSPFMDWCTVREHRHRQAQAEGA